MRIVCLHSDCSSGHNRQADIALDINFLYGTMSPVGKTDPFPMATCADMAAKRKKHSKGARHRKDAGMRVVREEDAG